jgi:hypothetical protein
MKRISTRDENETLTHTKRECKCHLVFIPKYPVRDDAKN